MNAPKRLKDMEGLSLEMRADLKEAQKPAGYNQALGLSAFSTRLGEVGLDQAAGLTGAHNTSIGASTESLRSAAVVAGRGAYWGYGAAGLAASILVGTTVLLQSGALVSEPAPDGGVAARHLDGAPRELSPEEQPHQAQAVITGSIQARASDNEVSASLGSAATGLTPTSLPLVTQDLERSVLATPTLPGVPPFKPEAGNLRQEVDELLRLRQLLATDPASVITELSSSPFAGRGQLEQERSALQIDALVRDGRESEAKEYAQSFLKAYPDSPARNRVACIAEAGRDGCH